MFVNCLIYFVGGTLFYTSFKSNSPSISVILGNVSSIVSMILGIIIFNEDFTIYKVIGISLILIAVVLVNLPFKGRIDKYNLNIFDLINYVTALINNCQEFVSYDRHFDKLAWVKRIEP